MDRNEAMGILDEANRDRGADSLYEGLTILKIYFPATKFRYSFEHDEAWIGAVNFDDYLEVITVEDVRRMGELGWYVDEDSWHITS